MHFAGCSNVYSQGNVEEIVPEAKALIILFLFLVNMVNPYCNFVRDARPGIVAQLPGASFATVSRALARKWLALPDDEKDRYREVTYRPSRGGAQIPVVSDVDSSASEDSFSDEEEFDDSSDSS